MKKLVVFIFLTVLLAGVPQITMQPKSAEAGTKACTATMVTAEICRNETNTLLYFDAPVAFWLSMADEICLAQGWQATVDDGEGGQIANPQSCNAFTQQWIRSVFINIEKSGRARAAAQAASDAIQAEPDPDVGEG